MAVVPGQQIGRFWLRCFLSPRQSDCYGHEINDGTRRPAMSNSSRSFPRPLSALLGATLSDALKSQGFASAEILARWADIAGPEIAAHSEPIKINWPRAVGDAAPDPATLILRVEGPAALEIQHLSAVILERVNRFFGWQAVGTISLRQAPLRRREKASPPPPPDPAVAARVAEGLPEVTDDALKQALARLGASIKRK
jgi:hypothetical protein